MIGGEIKRAPMGGMDEEKPDDGEGLAEESVHLRRMYSALKSGDMKVATSSFKQAVRACIEGGYDDESGEEDEDTGY